MFREICHRPSVIRKLFIKLIVNNNDIIKNNNSNNNNINLEFHRSCTHHDSPVMSSHSQVPVQRQGKTGDCLTHLDSIQ